MELISKGIDQMQGQKMSQKIRNNQTQKETCDSFDVGMQMEVDHSSRNTMKMADG